MVEKKKHIRYRKQFVNGTGIYDLNKYYDYVQATINVVIKNDKTKLFDVNQFYSEDEQFNANVLMDKKKIGYVKDAKYYYRRHNESVTAKKHNYDIEAIYKFHSELQNKYKNHPYIQSIIMNNLRWRIKEDCLYPKKLNKNEINSYLKKIQTRLSKINYTYFRNNKVNLDSDTLLQIISLSNINCTVRNNRLVCREGILFEQVKSYNNIEKINYTNNCFKIYGTLQTPYYYNNNVSLVAEIIDEKGKKKCEEVKLDYSLEYKKNYSRNYLLIVSNNTKRINFILKSNNAICDLISSSTRWCSTKKIYDKYQIYINNCIKIRKKNVFDYIFNKIVFTKNIKFYVIELLSFFEKKHIIYFGNKESIIYQMYLKDNHKNKVFIDDSSGIRYKKLLIRATKVVTNDDIINVLPFGTMQKKYIQISSFEVDEVDI